MFRDLECGGKNGMGPSPAIAVGPYGAGEQGGVLTGNSTYFAKIRAAHPSATLMGADLL